MKPARAMKRMIGFGALAVFGACGEPSSPVPIAYDDPVPIVHRSPTWIGADVLVLEDRGALDVGPGWLDVDLRQAGIVLWNVSTDSFDLLVPGAVRPRAKPSGGGFVYLTSDSFGAVGLWARDGSTLANDPTVWRKRSSVCVNDSLSLAAWRSFDGEHEIGIWVQWLASAQTTFVGEGSDCSWVPASNRLLYCERPYGKPPVLIVYDCDTGLREILWQLPEGLGGWAFALSPGCSEVAFYGSSLERAKSGLYVFDRESNSLRQWNERIGGNLTWGVRGIVYEAECDAEGYADCGVLWICNPDTGIDAPLTRRFQFVSRS
jgi:hypothetical protein